MIGRLALLFALRGPFSARLPFAPLVRRSKSSLRLFLVLLASSHRDSVAPNAPCEMSTTNTNVLPPPNGRQLDTMEKAKLPNDGGGRKRTLRIAVVTENFLPSTHAFRSSSRSSGV